MENKIKIFIDSCGELPKDLREKYDIDYCPMMISVEGQEVVASLDYDAGYSFHELFDLMRGGKRVYTTQVPPMTFEEKFSAAVAEGYDVLYIGCSSALSASVRSAEKVAAEIMAKNHGRSIAVFDSLNSCYGEGSMAIKASEMRDEGKTLDEIVAFLTENRLRFNQFATVDDLKYLKQAGRVKASSAFFGNLFGVHPIIISDENGANSAVIKVKGKKKALLALAENAVAAADDIANQTIYVGHADDEASALFVRDQILALAQPKEIYIGPIGPVIGASTGPGTVATYCFGKEFCFTMKKD